MVYKRKYGARKLKRSFKRRGYRTKSNFASRVQRVLRKRIELKYFDVGSENVQLYHNVGVVGGLVSPPQALIFNPWVNIGTGAGRSNRIGDKISPSGMALRIWVANKLDRPNVMYRIIAGIFPKYYAGTAFNGSNLTLYPAPNAGADGNNMSTMVDSEKGIKVLYDRIHNVNAGYSGNANTAPLAGAGKEAHKMIKIYIKRSKSRQLVYDVNGALVNNIFAMYVIPYDSAGTLQTDNIASVSCWYRMYFRDY